MKIEYRVLSGWVGIDTVPTQRINSRFKASYESTLGDLERELNFLNAKNVVLQIALDQKHIRIDGSLRAGAPIPKHSGIILSFESTYGHLTYPCDTFTNWKDNVRAITLSLEHLRAVDRYGVTKRGEQYAGWHALPNYSGELSLNESCEILGVKPNSNIEEVKRAFKAKALKCHPDQGGSVEQFNQVKFAYEVLVKHEQ